MTELEKQIIETFGFTENDFKKIESFFRPIQIGKGEFFLKQGQYPRQLAFVEKGVLREFLYINDKEITKWFSTKGYFAVDLSGFIYGEKSRVNYQALCDTSILAISKEDYDRIGDKVPEWDRLEKLFLIKCFTVLENRIISHLSLNAEERYKQMFNFQPHLFNQVPLHQIASMLGMSPETFSRIRNKLSSPKS